MKITIDIPDYVKGEGIDVIWKDGSVLKITPGTDKTLIVSGNECALRSIGEQLIYLAQSQVEVGSHIHYDEFFCENAISGVEIIVEKID